MLWYRLEGPGVLYHSSKVQPNPTITFTRTSQLPEIFNQTAPIGMSHPLPLCVIDVMLLALLVLIQ
jgi:hypothetical protein